MNNELGLRHFRAFAARLQSQLATLLHEPVSVRCSDLKTVSFSSISEPVFFYHLMGEDVPADTILGFGFDAPLFGAFLDRLQGGDGTVETFSLAPSRMLTRFETRLASRFLLLFQGSLRQTWNFPEPYDFEPFSKDAWTYGKELASVEFLLDFGNSEGTFRVLRPASLPNIKQVVTSQTSALSPLSALCDTPISISVQLSGSRIRPRDLLSWNIGDVVSLGRSEDFPFSVQIEGMEKFSASPGRYQFRKAFKILPANSSLKCENQSENPSTNKPNKGE